VQTSLKEQTTVFKHYHRCHIYNHHIILCLGKNLKRTPDNDISESVYPHAYPGPQVAPNRNLWLDAAYQIDHQKSWDDYLVLRLTGGWVRDKLFSLESTDIQVGINNITGYNFATGVFHFSKGNLDQYGLEPGELSKIESNPEKSQDLATGTMQIGGLDINFLIGEVTHILGMAGSQTWFAPLYHQQFCFGGDLDLMALEIRNAITRCLPLRLHHQRPLLEPTL